VRQKHRSRGDAGFGHSLEPVDPEQNSGNGL
jgi:hypothetical protein